MMIGCDINHDTHGMTLVEVLIASAIIGLLMTLAGQLMLLGYRSNAKTNKEDTLLLQSTFVLDYLGRELRLCEGMINPLPFQWQPGTPYSPEKGVRGPLVFRRYSRQDSANLVVAYEWNSGSGKIERFLYPSNLKFWVEGTSELPNTRKTLASNITSFEITRIRPEHFIGSTHFLNLELVGSLNEDKLALNLEIWAKDL